MKVTSDEEQTIADVIPDPPSPSLRTPPVAPSCPRLRDHPVNVAPGQHSGIRALSGIIATIDNVASNKACLTRTFHAIREALEVLEEVRGRCGARFDLDGCKFFALLDDQVDYA